MPKRACDICGQRNNYTRDDYRYLDKSGGALACSVKCVKSWLTDHADDRISPLELDGCSAVHLERPSQVYSSWLGRWFRSSFEFNVAEVMDSAGFIFTYEAIGFKWNSKVYTPDFYFPYSKAFLEVKGKWGASQRSKYSDFRKYFPKVALLVVPWTLDAEFRKMQKGLRDDTIR